MNSFKRICVAYNTERATSQAMAERFEFALDALGLEHTRCALGIMSPVKTNLAELQGIDLVLVLGGDGTLLDAARRLSAYRAPFLGINAGHLGFLSEASSPQEPEAIEHFLAKILRGEYTIDPRTMLYAEVVRGKQHTPGEKNHLTALNDIVIARSSRSHILQINLEVNGTEIAQYHSDGLIVCTPTGSTAYSLAAGGAVMSPDLNALGIVPICAHSLTSRPLVISDSSELKIRVNPRNRTQSLITVQADGQETFLLEPEDFIWIKKANTTVQLIRSLDVANNFYKVLSQKLLWGRSNQQ